MDVYFISGLGADERAFERIKLSDAYSIHHLPWITPLKNESLAGYAKRLSTLIDTTKPFALVGLSMGGMIAAAMNDFLQPQVTILLSSAGSAAELPAYFRWCGKFKLHQLLPSYFFNQPNGISHWLFGAKTATEKTLMNRIMKEADPEFTKWAIGAILTWTGSKKPATCFHIHGSRDKILPLRFIKPDVVLEGGSHFMVWTKGSTVSKLLEEALARRQTAESGKATA